MTTIHSDVRTRLRKPYDIAQRVRARGGGGLAGVNVGRGLAIGKPEAAGALPAGAFRKASVDAALIVADLSPTSMLVAGGTAISNLTKRRQGSDRRAVRHINLNR